MFPATNKMVPSSVLSADLECYFVKPCPLCKADVRYCLISLTEKVLMCVNVYCDYPFGYEDLQFSPLEFKVNIEAARSILAEFKESDFFPVFSFLASSDVDKFNKVLQSEKSQLFNLDEAPENSKRTSKFDCISNKKLKEELEDLEHLITKFNEMDIVAEHNASKSFCATTSLASSDIDKFNKVLLSEQSQLFNFGGAPKYLNRTIKFDCIRNKKFRKELEDLECQITKLKEMGRGAEHTASKSFCATSSLASSDIDKFNKLFQSEENELLSLDVAPKYSNEKSKSDFVSEKLAKDIEDLKNLTNELNKMKLAKTDKADIIKKQKFYKKIIKLQGSPGRKLLKKKEMELLKEKHQHVVMMDYRST